MNTSSSRGFPQDANPSFWKGRPRPLPQDEAEVMSKNALANYTVWWGRKRRRSNFQEDPRTS